MLHQIKHRLTGNVLFSLECASLKIAVEAAVKAHCTLRGSYLSGSDLSGSDLRGSDLRGSYLSGSDLSGSDLSGSYLRGSNLRGSNLRGSDLSWSNLRGSDVSWSNLRGSNLRGSNLSGSNLRGSNLSGSDLSWSNLSGSNLSGSNLRGAKIRAGIVVNKIPLQITGAEWDITIWDEHMQIGCEFHSLSEWFGFDDHRILEMDSKKALKFWRDWKKPLQAICKAEGRG